jgi:hypothetical protein
MAMVMYINGDKPNCSTAIDGDTITVGYGKLDNFGYWEYPLPKDVVKHKYGTLSWKKYMELKGFKKELNQYG